MCKVVIFALVGWLFTIHFADAQCLGACCTTSPAAATALQWTVPQNKQWIVGVNLLSMQYHPLSDEELLSYATASAPVYSVNSQKSFKGMISYGISKRIAVTASLPYNLSVENREGHYHLEEGAAEIHTYGNIQGIGDGIASVNYVFLDNKDKGWKASAGAGIKIPTGKTDAYSTYAVILPIHLQPGTGSWDPLVNAAVQKQSGRWYVLSDANVKFATTAKEHNMGTYASTRIAAGYEVVNQLSHKLLPTIRGTAGFLGDYNSAMKMMISESHLHGADSTAVAGSWAVDPNTGFMRLFAQASMTAFVTERLFVPFTFSLPIAQQLNGYQASIKYTLTIGVSYIL